MKMIQPTCRARFTARDIDFVVDVLGRSGKGSAVLVGLLADEDTRDLILDDPELHAALLERGGCLEVSARFYFYVLVQASPGARRDRRPGGGRLRGRIVIRVCAHREFAM